MPTKKQPHKALAVTLGVLGVLAAIYLGFAAWLHFDQRFPFRTTLNGRDVSLRSAAAVQHTCMLDFYPNMLFEIDAPGALPYRVTPLVFDFSDAQRAEEFLLQNPLLWPKSLFSDSEYVTSDGNAIDKLAHHIEADYAAFRNKDPAQSAIVRYDAASDSFVILAPARGGEIDRAAFESALRHHILYGSGTLDLAEAHVYREAEVNEYPPELTDTRDRLNRFLSASIEFPTDSGPLCFEVRSLLPYLSVSWTGDVVYNAEAAAASGVFDRFVAKLADAYAPPTDAWSFTAHDGEIVSVPVRSWQAEFDPEATAATLAALRFDELSAPDGPPEILPIWETPPLSALRNYVEIDLTNQQLYLYTDGALVLETPIVSGSLATRHRTPAGAYTLVGKHRNVTLRGPDYANFVRYWMPFNGGIGLHDAPWRRNFGGTIYKTNGSHGCINLPADMAETIFGIIDASYAIVCYWRE